MISKYTFDPNSISYTTWFAFKVALVAIILWPSAVQAESPDTPPDVSGGRALWGENCAPCHGQTGQGDGPTAGTIPDPLPNFADPTTARQLIPAENFKVIKNGRIEKLMPPWGARLNDSQIWDLTAYVWSLSLAPDTLAAGKVIYTQQCAACHGPNGAGDGPKATAKLPSLADPALLVKQSQTDLAINFLKQPQHAGLNTLAEAELDQALDYIRSFSFKMPQRNGWLKGQVINATTNKPQGNVTLTLRAFDGATIIESKTVQADAFGNFSIDQLVTDHTIFYLLEGNYKDILYLNNDPGIFAPNETETTLNLKVYETTTNPAAIGLAQLHYLISFSPEAANVVQIFLLSNKGDKTYIGQNGQTFAFSLPSNVQNVSFQNDETNQRFRQTGNNYNDTAPITPGDESQTIVATYALPYEDSLTINIPLPADVPQANVLIQDQGAQLSSEQLKFVETRDFQGNSFSLFNGANLGKGQLTLQLTNLDSLTFAADPLAPQAATMAQGSHNQDWLRWGVIAVGAIVLVVVGIAYPRWRPSPEYPVNRQNSNLHRQKLLVMLARLDELFEAGEVDKQFYHRVRAKYKAELVELMDKS